MYVCMCVCVCVCVTGGGGGAEKSPNSECQDISPQINYYINMHGEQLDTMDSTIYEEGGLKVRTLLLIKVKEAKI